MIPFFIAYTIVICAYAYRELHMRIGKDAQSMKGGSFDKGSSLLGALFIAITFISPLFFLLLRQDNLLSPLLQWCGVGLTTAGMLFNLWSVRTLGRFYARTLLVQKKHIIVEQGPYSVIRHPGYFGASVAGLGLGLSSGNMFIFLLMVSIMILYYSYRIHFEEKMLIEEFGETYRMYRKKTWKVIPYIY